MPRISIGAVRINFLMRKDGLINGLSSVGANSPKMASSVRKRKSENAISFRWKNCLAASFPHIAFHAYTLHTHITRIRCQRIYLALFPVVLPLKFARNSFARAHKRMRDVKISTRATPKRAENYEMK